MNTNFDLLATIRDIDAEELTNLLRGLQGKADITVVVTGDGFTEIIEGVDPQTIRYIMETDAIYIGGLGHPYSLTVRDPGTITAIDATLDRPETDWQFDIEGDSVTVSIMVHLEAK